MQCLEKISTAVCRTTCHCMRKNRNSGGYALGAVARSWILRRPNADTFMYQVFVLARFESFDNVKHTFQHRSLINILMNK